MKKIFTILLTVISLGYAWAQTPTTHKRVPQFRKNNVNTYNTQAARTAEAPKLKLDSTVSEYDKYVYTYDNNGNVLTKTGSQEDAGHWFIISKHNRTYNSQNQLIQEITYETDGINKLVLTEKGEFTYTEAGELSVAIYYGYEDNGDIYPYEKDEYTYNAQNKLTGLVMYSRNDDNTAWENYYGHDYTLDSKGNAIFDYGKRWEKNSWDTRTKDSIAYNTNNQAISTYRFTNVTSVGTPIWFPSEKIDYTYDNNHNILTKLTYNYDYANNVWLEHFKVAYAYNLTYGPSSFIQPGLNDFFVDQYNMTTKDERLYYEDGAWLSDKITKYNYSSAVTAVEDIIVNSPSLKIYPNPASEFVIIKTDDTASVKSISILDLQGNILVNETSLSDNKVSVKHLTQGLYIYKIVENNKTTTGKIVIE